MTKNIKDHSILNKLMKPQPCVLENINTIIGINSKFQEFETNLREFIKCYNKRDIDMNKYINSLERKIIESLKKQRQIDLEFLQENLAKNNKISKKKIIEEINDIIQGLIVQVNKKMKSILPLFKQFNDENARQFEEYETKVSTLVSELEQRFEDYETKMTKRVSELEQRLATFESK